MDVRYVSLANDTPFPEDDCAVLVRGKKPPIAARLKRVWVLADGTEIPASSWDRFTIVRADEDDEEVPENSDPWERAGAIQNLSDWTAGFVACAREAGIDDETILAHLQGAADALREGLK